jgi:lambda family phage tail tape measure protein
VPRIGASGRGAERVSDAQRYLESLRQQLQATQDLTTVEKTLTDIQSGRLKLSASVTQAQLLAIASEVDAVREAQRIARERADARNAEEAAANEAARENIALERERAKAIEQSRASADALFQSIVRAQQRDLDSRGQGQQERDRNAARQQIEDRYENQRLELEGQRRSGQISQERYDSEIRILSEFQSKALASYESYFNELDRRNADFSLGAQEALANYLDSARNVAEQSEQAFSRAFQGLEDALVQFVTTGKADFKSLANSIIADIIRIQIRQLLTRGGDSSPIASIGAALSGLFGGKETGGTVFPGSAQRVTERGPELLTVGRQQFLLMGSQGGQVTPTDKLGGKSVSVNVQNTFTVQGNTDRRTQQQIAAAVGRSVEIATARNN